MPNKNDEIEIDITDIGTEGEGIGHVTDSTVGGMTVFVSDAVVGDRVLAHVMKVKKNLCYAFTKSIIIPSPFRTEPKCPVAKKCGGCTIQHLDYAKQLEYKQEKVENCISRIGGIKPVPMEPIIGVEEPYFYRNKAQFPVGTAEDGAPEIGFYARRSHRIIHNDICCIQADVNTPIIQTIRNFMIQNKVSAYDEITCKGLVRHIFTRIGFATGEVQVCIVINGNRFEIVDKLVPLLQSAVDNFGSIGKTKNKAQLTSVCLNVNKDNTNVIMGRKTECVWGQPYIMDCIGKTAFHISPQSFYQVNPEQTKKLYDTVLEYSEFTGKEIVWDLYCGIGTISLYMAPYVGKVYGIEIVKEAIEDAKANARLNHIENAEFFVGAAEDVLPICKEKVSEHTDVVVVDPPRKGCDERLLETVIQMNPKKLVYVSCDPATLARDLKYLVANGYELKRVRPVDQFCHTTHVETVCLLLRK